MPSKGASELNQAEKDRQIEEKIRSQINGIKALIQQNVTDHIPHRKQEEIEVLGITYDDYVPLGKVDYKGLNCVVHYARKTYDEQGNSQILQEHMVFSLDEEGNIVDGLAKVNEEGVIELTPEFEARLEHAQNSELVKDQDDKHYLVREDGKLKAVDQEEKTRMQDKEETEKEEIAQSYRKMRGKDTEGKDNKGDDEILSITEIEDPSTFARVLEVPLEQAHGKYKLVRFKGDRFILVDDKNQVKAGLEVSELATDIHSKLNIRPEDEDTRIRPKDLEPASTEPR